MKTVNLWSALFVALISLPAIAGVSVGNGQTYWSKAGFSVVYAGILSLHVLNEDEFCITNENLVGSSGPVSKATFSVVPTSENGAPELPLLLANSAANFKPVTISGVQGYYSEAATSAAIVSQYYFISPRKELLKITLDAHADGEGLELVAPIVRSLSYDNTPPVVDQVRLDAPTWSAGSQHKVFMHITDDLSGVDVRVGEALIAWPHQPRSDAELLFLSDKGLKDEGGGWFSISVDVNRYQQSGPYEVIQLKVSDRAGNELQLTADYSHPKKFFEIESPFSTDDKLTSVLIPHLRVSNAGLNDAQSPRLLEIRRDESVWKAGSTNRMYFRARDVGSGLDISTIGCDGLSPLHSNDWRALPCQNPRAEGKGWYSVELPLSRWTASGTYALPVLIFADIAGNTSRYETYTSNERYDWDEMQRVGVGAERTHELAGPAVFKVDVVNPGPVDLTPPEILEVKVDSNVWRAGEMETIRFRATDDLSGVQLGPVHLNPDDSSALLFALPPAARVVYTAQSGIVYADGNDWYHVTFRLGLIPEIDQLLIESFGVKDNAGNYGGLDCNDPTTGNPVVKCKNTQGRELPPIYVKVLR